MTYLAFEYAPQSCYGPFIFISITFWSGANSNSGANTPINYDGGIFYE